MGEFNVNKSDGSLEQTAGMPDTYPATQVMLSDGVTSVEDVLADTGWVQIGTTGTYYRKVGDVVWVKGHGLISASSWGLIATLPIGYRPAINIYQCLYVDATHQRSIKIEKNGDISMFSDFALDFELSFII